MEKFYITTAIAYVNAEPHIGFALELLQADVLARYHRLNDDNVYFLTGTDEHGTKVAEAAKKAGKEPKDFVDDIAKKYIKLAEALNISNNDFIRTSDKVRHWPTAIKIWNKLLENGDLYKKDYEGLYCTGHEAFIKKSELIDGPPSPNGFGRASQCSVHKTEPQIVKEENWFFRLSKYKDEIRKKIEDDELKIVPTSRKNEIVNLLKDAEDVSFSRPIESLKWGIPVPNDPTQTMYVWTDALTNYISALGYDKDDAKFKDFWPADVHLIGKDILRFHAMIWPGILLACGIPLPKAIYVHGFITVDDEKMSKSLGNVIDPFELIDKYGVDAVRYFLLREIPSDEDGDFSYKKIEDRYNGELANGLGNLVQRVATLIDDKLDGELIHNDASFDKELKNNDNLRDFFDDKKFDDYISDFKLHEALGNHISSKISFANKFIDLNKPWAIVNSDPERFIIVMNILVLMIHNISWLLYPFIPQTCEKIFETFGVGGKKEIEDRFKCLIKKGQGLFPRIS